MKKYIYGFLSLCVFLTACKSAPVATQTSELEFTASRLKTMDLDEMSDLMQGKARQFKKTEDVQILKDGLVIAFGRPDEDSVVEKILSPIRTPLEDRDLWEPSIEEIVDRSIAGVKNEALSPADQVTYGVILENIIAEFKPAFIKQYKSPGFESKIIEKIADAEIEFSRAAASERKLNLMITNLSPSLVAEKMIDKREDFLTKEEEEKEE